MIKNTLSSDECNKEMPKHRAAFRSGILKHTWHRARPQAVAHRICWLHPLLSPVPMSASFLSCLSPDLFPQPLGSLVLNLEISKDLDGILTSYFISNSLSHLLHNLINKQQGFYFITFLYYYYYCLCHVAYGILVSQPRI